MKESVGGYDFAEPGSEGKFSVGGPVFRKASHREGEKDPK